MKHILTICLLTFIFSSCGKDEPPVYKSLRLKYSSSIDAVSVDIMSEGSAWFFLYPAGKHEINIQRAKTGDRIEFSAYSQDTGFYEFQLVDGGDSSQIHKGHIVVPDSVLHGYFIVK